ncbi:MULTISPECIES: CHC2 zinc finger domain-containing protein [Saccharomonospora]|uniref:CHC2 zinc finger domain-containing protein n=1 Tax=Saccharomonospora TaxID=1851 RepID=UPI0012F7455D
MLHERGPRPWYGRCPFFASTTFQVRPTHGTYHCFGRCNAGTARTSNARVEGS